MLHVAVAVVEDDKGRVLIQQRAGDAHQGGLWEFPGGKLENGETVSQALVRELREETGIRVKASQPLIRIRHQYEDLAVLLDVHKVGNWSGTARSLEGQPLQWVAAADLQNWQMPAADAPIVNAIQLPPSYIITPPVIENTDTFLTRFKALLDNGERLFLYRVKTLKDISHDELAAEMLTLCNAVQARLVLHESSQVNIEAHGRHLTSAGLMSAGVVENGELVGVSCHSAEELNKACQINAAFALLSPVKPTASHPGATVLGWEKFTNLAEAANLPVYALGGMCARDVDTAREHAAQGVAGISDWWSA